MLSPRLAVNKALYRPHVDVRRLIPNILMKASIELTSN